MVAAIDYLGQPCLEEYSGCFAAEHLVIATSNCLECQSFPVLPGCFSSATIVGQTIPAASVSQLKGSGYQAVHRIDFAVQTTVTNSCSPYFVGHLEWDYFNQEYSFADQNQEVSHIIVIEARSDFIAGIITTVD